MLAKMLDEYLEFNRTPLVGEGSKFHVSDAGRCHLYRFWKRKAVEPTDLPSTRALRIFEVGNVFHSWLQDVLDKSGNLISKELTVEDQHRKGRIDAIVNINGQKILYDFKTVHSKKFSYDQLDAHYCMQAYTYKTMLNQPVDDVKVLYISKDDLRLYEISVYGLKDIDVKVRNDWESLIESWVKDKEPEPNPNDWECRYCIYKTRCRPSIPATEQIELVTVEDRDMEAMLERRAELLEFINEFDELEDTIKKKVKELPQITRIGRWILERKTVKRASYEVPDNIKQQYKVTREYEKLVIQEV